MPVPEGGGGGQGGRACSIYTKQRSALVSFLKLQAGKDTAGQEMKGIDTEGQDTVNRSRSAGKEMTDINKTGKDTVGQGLQFRK